MKKKNYDEYGKNYSEESFLNKIAKNFKAAGIAVVYAALVLFYTMKRKETPIMAKATIAGALGYFILPIDFIPDTIPVIGFGDDLTALTTALTTVSHHITDEVKNDARNTLREWFGNYDDSLIATVEVYI